MEFRPHDYQKAAIDFIREHDDSALLLDCGLGKTIIVLTDIKEEDKKLVLVVAPKLVVGSWIREVKKWDHLKDISIVAIEGNEKQRMEAIRTPARIHVISRDNIAWFASFCNLNQFDMIVMDESSSFKDETSQRTKALIGLDHPKKVILTGTPIPKNIEDLYSQYKILDGGKRLGAELSDFRRMYMYKKGRVWKPLPGAQQTVFRRVKDITISMKSDELLNLPPVTTVRNEVAMTAEEQAVFDRLAKDLCLEYKGIEINVDNAGVLSNKLAQLSNGFFYDENKVAHTVHQHKKEELEALLEASACNGEDVVVAYNFEEDRENIIKTCKDLGIPALDMKENKNVEAFIAPGDSRVAMVHPKSAGMGLNLQEHCHRLIWYSLPYSYEEFYQTLKRVYRQGQTEHTFIHSIECLNSYDQRIRDIVNAKGNCNEALLQTTKWMADKGFEHREDETFIFDLNTMLAALNQQAQTQFITR